MRIIVDPIFLRDLARQFYSLSRDLSSQQRRFPIVSNDMDLESQLTIDLDNQLLLLSSMASTLLTRADEIARFLESKALAFEEADQEGAASIGGLSSNWVSSFISSDHSIFPNWTLNAIWNLGSLFSKQSNLQLTVVPVAGGMTVIGLSSLTYFSGSISQLQNLSEKIWNWLYGYGWKSNSELATPIQSSTASGSLTRQLSQTDAKLASPSGEITPLGNRTAALPVDQLPAAQWWLAVPTQSQQGLKLDGQPNEFGCTPTSTSMILDYWHSQNPANKTMSAQDLISVNVKEGQYSTTGMSASNIHDEVRNLGYSLVEDHTNSDLAGLKDALKDGPVIAIVKLGIKPSGYNHAVVVTGISSDNQIRINDPWDGQAHTYSWDDFSHSWGADFGKDAPKNSFVVIRP